MLGCMSSANFVIATLGFSLVLTIKWKYIAQNQVGSTEVTATLASLAIS